jgi:hypothetical protein
MKIAHRKLKIKSLESGFTIFFAMLVGSLALSVGLAIYDLTVREIDLSAAASQSQYAIYAADTGVECALYWDAKYNGVGSAFGSSTPPASTWGVSPINCNGQDIVISGPPASFLSQYTGALNGCVDSAHWCIVSTAPNSSAADPSKAEATTTFSVSIPPSAGSLQNYCAIVQVGKSTVTNVLYTNVVSRGYNNCNSTGAARLERTLRVNY